MIKKFSRMHATSLIVVLKRELNNVTREKSREDSLLFSCAALR